MKSNFNVKQNDLYYAVGIIYYAIKLLILKSIYFTYKYEFGNFNSKLVLAVPLSIVVIFFSTSFLFSNTMSADSVAYVSPEDQISQINGTISQLSKTAGAVADYASYQPGTGYDGILLVTQQTAELAEQMRNSLIDRNNIM